VKVLVPIASSKVVVAGEVTRIEQVPWPLL
jgi:hypothetical protein